MAIKLLLEGLGLGFLLYLICAIGIRRGAVGMVHLYSKAVQNRAVELGLTSFDEIRKRSLVFKGLCIPGYEKAKEIIETLGVDVSKYDPFMSHEGVVARTIMYRDELNVLIRKYPNAVCINLGCGFDDKFSQVDNGKIRWFDVDLPDQIAVRS